MMVSKARLYQGEKLHFSNCLCCTSLTQNKNAQFNHDVLTATAGVLGGAEDIRFSLALPLLL